jgi:uncharacterized paraquat-inducible protein A
MEDDTEILCPECDARFEVIWSYNPDILCVEFCPFCGEQLYRESGVPGISRV